jgi:hypothetical protein
MAMKKAKKGPIDYPKGASKKAIAAQGARGNAQAIYEIKKKKRTTAAASGRLQAAKDSDTKNRLAKSASAQAKTDSARKKPVKDYRPNIVRGTDKANALVLIKDQFTPGGKFREKYDEKNKRSPYTYKYKGAGSKQNKKGK